MGSGVGSLEVGAIVGSGVGPGEGSGVVGDGVGSDVGSLEVGAQSSAPAWGPAVGSGVVQLFSARASALAGDGNFARGFVSII